MTLILSLTTFLSLDELLRLRCERCVEVSVVTFNVLEITTFLVHPLGHIMEMKGMAVFSHEFCMYK